MSWLLRGGRVVDGTGDPAVAVDVLVRGGRVGAVGPELACPDDVRVLDVGGHVVAPGFIDVHSHADASLLAATATDSAVHQGVTTLVVGNCGVGMAPVSPPGLFERVAPPGVAHAVPPWRTVPEYLEHLSDLAINVAVLVAHGPLRNVVTGGSIGPASPSEVRAMRGLLREAIEAGAAGFSTGLEYPPGDGADIGEIQTLVDETARGGGLYATHVRDRGYRFLEAVDEALATASAAGCRLQLSHLAPRPYAPVAAFPAVLERLRAASGEGTVFADTFPDTRGPDALFEILPPAFTALSVPDLLERLRSTWVRSVVRDHFDRRDGFLLRSGGPEDIRITSHPLEPALVGSSLAELADTLGRTAADVTCDVLLAAGDQAPAVGISHPYTRGRDLRMLIREPFTSFGSDAMVGEGEDENSTLPPNRSAYGYAPRVLQEYVRELGLLSLPEAVRRLARLPAMALGLDDRGIVRAGAHADLVVFDPDAVVDTTTDELQARHPLGIRHVIVAGEAVVLDGVPTDARPGRVVSSS